jgi:D-alanine-D-alanine ligase-like ATP-grasp enzyme/GNAT superfamily N-acetyltransferase
MKVVILHNAVADADSPSDRDVLVQVEAVEQALRTLGHVPRRLACTLNLEAIEQSLTLDRPGVVFNLVESLGGSDRLAHLAAALLDDLDIPYTGTHAANLHLTNNKPAAKDRLRAAGLPTADWVVGAAGGALGMPGGTAGVIPGPALQPPYIIKAVWEHASVGLDDHAIIRTGDGSTVVEQIESRSRQLGRTCFAEQYIDGREFNLSLLANGPTPHVLPPAEIDFSAFPKGKPRIVGYSAKWDERAFEFEHTPRKFDFPASDAPLLDTLRSLALECWRLFDLRGYARVDFRVDAKGRPWVLEINANPCLSPDAGFAAALVRAHLPFERAVEWILEDALHSVGNALRGVPSPASTTSTLTPALSPREREKAAKLPRGTSLRTTVQPSDTASVRRIVESTGLFRPGEIDVAVELVQAHLDKGPASGYEFVFAEQKGEVVAYACFGRNALTEQSWDLYWIAVEKSLQGNGLGRVLLQQVHDHIARAGGGRVYIETSHRADYQATRGFYERCGYQLEAVLTDFYAPGDSKAIYVGQVSNLP